VFNTESVTMTSSKKTGAAHVTQQNNLPADDGAASPTNDPLGGDQSWPKPPPDDDVWDIGRVGEFFGRKRSWVHQKEAEGIIPAAVYLDGGRRYYKTQIVEARRRMLLRDSVRKPKLNFQSEGGRGPKGRSKVRGRKRKRR
jgi:hypothetical protein